jgi:hypothetical protein
MNSIVDRVCNVGAHTDSNEALSCGVVAEADLSGAITRELWLLASEV